MSDLVKCSRCKKTLIAESFRGHDCSPIFRDAKTIMIDWHTMTHDAEGRETILAKGMDGTLLRLVINDRDAVPIPFKPAKRKFTGDETNANVTEPPRRCCYLIGTSHDSMSVLTCGTYCIIVDG